MPTHDRASPCPGPTVLGRKDPAGVRALLEGTATRWYHLALLESWLRSYLPEELFDSADGTLCPGSDPRVASRTQINPGHLGAVSGLINDQPAVVVPGGGFEVGGSLTGSATSTVVYGVSGTSYRYARFVSAVSRRQDAAVESWTVSSDVYSWSCRQRGAGRNPVTDCGNGTQQYTRGRVGVPAPADPRAYSVVLPLSYYARVIDSRGRPLANPYRTSTGHWLLQAQAQYHGWIWTVEWTVGNVGMGRVAGSSFIGVSRIVLTDGPFN